MHVIVAIILIIRLVLYISNRSGGTGGPSSANNPPTKWFLFAPFIFLSVTLLSFGYIQSPLVNVIYLAVFIFCFPSLIAKITIALGWVKISYWLGRMAIAIHTLDNFGGGLFYGWRALQNTKPEKKEALQSWLENKLFSHTSVLRSGAMVMQVLFKIDKLADTQIMELLRLLNGCNKRLIPGNISRYICRFMLARDIPSGDWKKIAATAGQWHGFTINPLANRILYVYWCKRPGAKKKTFFRNIYTYLLAGFPTFERYLPPYETKAIIPSLTDKSGDSISLQDLKLAEWWMLKYPVDNTENLNHYWQTYLQSEHYFAWNNRLQELGSYNINEDFEKIGKSITDVMSYRQGADALDSDGASQEKDKNFTLLQIKIRAVNQRLNNKKLMSGTRELEEWFSIALLAQKLGSDKASYSQVYYILRSPCWNWVVELWNNANNKPLGFLICSFMSPMATTMSDNDSREFFGGIISDKYK